MGDVVDSKLLEGDWAAEWQDIEREHEGADYIRRNPEFWNRMAASPRDSGEGDRFIERFIEKLDLRPDESALDMGCGTGSLAIPLAQTGRKVIAADFAPRMVEAVQRQAADRNLSTIFPLVLSWDDDWAARGLAEKSVDVAIACRSLIVDDLKSALLKLDGVARRRVCIAVRTDGYPHVDARLARELGRPLRKGGEWLYCVLILVQEGILPTVSYVESAKSDGYASFDEAYERSCASFDSLTTAERRRIDAYLKEHLVAISDGPGIPITGTGRKAVRFTLDHRRTITWAIITWDVDRG